MRLADAQAIAERCSELEAANQELTEMAKDAERALVDCKKDAENMLKNVKAEAELTTERAVMAKEREMHELLRKSENETKRLAGQIEQLKTDLSWIPTVALKKDYIELQKSPKDLKG